MTILRMAISPEEISDVDNAAAAVAVYLSAQ